MKFLTDLTKSQIWANARHYITFAGGMLVMFGVLGVTGQKEFVEGAVTVMEAAEKILAALAVIAGVLAPIINGWISSNRASPVAKIEDVKAMAADPKEPKSDEAKTALVEATNSITEVEGVLTADTVAGRKLAESIPAPTVVPAGTKEAVKVAKGGTP
jgi:hypothetical protein